MEIVSPESVGVCSEQLAHLRPALQRYVDAGRVAGIVTLVARNGRIFQRDSWGFQDVAQQTPMQPDSIFRIYSMTKPMVSVGLMMLLEQGKFQLTDPLHKYIPEFKEMRVMNRDGSVETAVNPITIHHILTHQAGLSYGFFQDSPVEAYYQKAELFQEGMTLAQMVEIIADLPLVYQPGTAWRYSVATDVVGRLIEVLADQSLGDYLHEKLIQPLGMVDTDYEIAAEKLPRFTTMYGDTQEHGPMTVLDVPESSPHTRKVLNQRGGSGLLSTADDYIKFGQMILNKGEYNGTRYLGSRTVDFMTQNHIPATHFPLAIGDPMYGKGFGLGFSVVMNVAETGVMCSLGNHGWSGMADTNFWVDPVENLVGSTYIQYIGLETCPLRYDFRNILYAAIKD